MSFRAASLLLAGALAGPAAGAVSPPDTSTAPVRLGYFHGGRTNLLYRAYTHGCFETAGVDLVLYSNPKLRANAFGPIARDAWIESDFAAKATGVQIVDRIASGELEAGAIGEASFLDAIARGKPVVAVALLGHQSAEKPGHALILRTGVKIERPQDFKGKTLISRRAGPMDEALLRDFIAQQGLDPDKDVRLLPQVHEDEALSLLVDGKADGGLYHLLSAKHLIKSGAAYLYRPMDWANPEMMQALLVFNPGFVKRFPEKVQRVVDGYVARIAYERSLPDQAKDRSGIKGLMMVEDFEGLSIPSYDLPPKVRPEVLRQVQQLLLRHGALKSAVDVDRYVDNGFVERAASRLSASAPLRCLDHPRLPFRNILVLGWDGTRRERLRALLSAGKLPHLARLVSSGTLAEVEVTTGETDTKAGWAQILTGYDPEVTGVFDNRTRYRSIPEGYTVFERLRSRLGDGIVTVMLSGKSQNLGARGPHSVCVNCERGLWWDPELYARSKIRPAERAVLEMPAEPYFKAKGHIDVFANGLGSMDHVGERVLESLRSFRDRRFFLFAEFEEPDEQGHEHGEGSPEYSQALPRLDAWLGKIVGTLKDLQLSEQTLIYVVSDHGFAKESTAHAGEHRAPETFLATNDPAVARDKADRKDMSPTWLDRFGVVLGSLQPPLDGRSLLDSPRN